MTRSVIQDHAPPRVSVKAIGWDCPKDRADRGFSFLYGSIRRCQARKAHPGEALLAEAMALVWCK